ncbi:MAG: DedA family protein [Bacteroidales bacterium]|nr:DedA family protein [Bacteroidales bacterium]
MGAFIQWCLDHLNYWTVTLLMTIESSFIPFPSEVIVPPAAYRAASTGEMNLLAILLCATLGAVLGALINYGLAAWLGRPLVLKFVNSKIGHLCMLNEEKLHKAEAYFNRHGAVSTLVGRLIPAIRQLISIPAGLSGMKLLPFIGYTALGAGLWNSVLAGLGYWLESQIPEDRLIDTVTRYSHEIGYGIAAVVAVVLLFLIVRNRLKKKQRSKINKAL